MESALPALNCIVALVTVVLLVLVWRKLKEPAGQNLDQALREELRLSRDEASKQARDLREEVSTMQTNANDVLVRAVNALGENQKHLFGEFMQTSQGASLAARSEIEKLLQQTNDALKEIQRTTDDRFGQVRQTLDDKLRQMMEDQKKQLADIVTALKGLEKAHQEEQQKAREGLDQKFQQIRDSNEKKLEEMRKTVDEKLHDTLERRLGESFKLVSERLEAVQRGLGEMQNLATGVGDLKRVLTNVKERGTWGEYQLGAILEQILTPEQYGRNIRVQDERETVEFAVKMPGKSPDNDKPVWLPIDAKFPKEDYERLMAAAATADAEGVKQATKDLLNGVAVMARDIQKKYIAPPHTTDFGILFLPTEGLYSEILRQPGFHDELQQKYRVLVAGPTTLSAILNSLRVGFQTLAIEKRAHEVWIVLGAVKTEFGKFGEVLTKVKNQLKTAARTLDETDVRTRAMERKLRTVEQLSPEQAVNVLEMGGNVPKDESSEATSEGGNNPSLL